MGPEYPLVFCSTKTAWRNCSVSKIKHWWKNTLQIIKYNLKNILQKNKKCKCWAFLFFYGKGEQQFYPATVALDTLDRQREIPLALCSFTPGQTGGEENSLCSQPQRTLRRMEISLLRTLQHLQNPEFIFYISTLFWWNKQLDFSKSKFKTQV